MKKLIIGAIVLCAAVMAHASACSWSLTNVYQPGTETQSNGYVAYLFIAEGSTYDTASLVSMIEAGTGIASLAKTQGTTTAGKASGSGVEAGLASSTTYTAVAVVFDAASQTAASNYMVSKTVTKTVAATGASVTFGFGTQAENTWHAMAVPEPTSGLLILLGMAGLALKRKQA